MIEISTAETECAWKMIKKKNVNVSRRVPSSYYDIQVTICLPFKSTHIRNLSLVAFVISVAQLAGAVEYTDCTSAEG